MRLKTILSTFFILLCLLLWILPSQATAFGRVASELMQPTQYIAKLLRGICLATGIGLMLSSMIKYIEYRRHHHVRFSLIFFLLIAGFAMVGLGFLPLPTTWH